MMDDEKIERLQKEIIQFLRKLFNSLQRKANVILLGLFLVMLPPQNAYSSWQLTMGKPLVRKADISLPAPQEYPVNITGKELPRLSAKSAIVVDIGTKAVLFSKQPDQRLYPASTTKMMTALVVLENFKLDEVITVNDLNGTLGQTMKLEPLEQLKVKDLLYGLLVQSGNDAAIVLANHYPGGKEAFVGQMNNKAHELFLFDTNFQNPSGIEALGHVSTVHDLAILGAEVMKNPVLTEITATPKIEVTDISGKIVHELTNINQLVGRVPGLAGIKTGWTENAGECLVSYVERDGKKIITAILGSNDRFGETKTIIDWVFENHQWQEIRQIVH